jgi:hypothetical protein
MTAKNVKGRELNLVHEFEQLEDVDWKINRIRAELMCGLRHHGCRLGIAELWAFQTWPWGMKNCSKIKLAT